MTLWYSRKYKADPLVVLYPHSAEPIHLLDLKLNVNLNTCLIVPRKIAKSAGEFETEMMSTVIPSDIVLLFFSARKIPCERYVFFYC